MKKDAIAKDLRGILVAAVVLTCTGLAYSQFAWESAVSGTTANLQKVIYADGRFVAIGDRGTILVSSTGTTWEKVPSHTSYDLKNMAYGAGRYVVMGDSGTILTSVDAETWEIQTVDEKIPTIVIFGLDKFWRVAPDFSWYYSNDGSQWNLHPTAKTPPHGISSIAFGNGTFVVISRGLGSYYLSSTNMIDWVPDYSEQNRGTRFVTFHDSVFITAKTSYSGTPGYRIWVIYYDKSYDGIQWNFGGNLGEFSQEAAPYSGIHVDKGFPHGGIDVLIGETGTFKSLIWANAASNPDYTMHDFVDTSFHAKLLSIAYGNGVFVAVGNAGIIVTSKLDSRLATSLSNSGMHASMAGATAVFVKNNRLTAVLPAGFGIHGMVSIRVLNNAGKLVYTARMPVDGAKVSVQLPRLNPGMYTARFSDGKTVKNYSFLLCAK